MILVFLFVTWKLSRSIDIKCRDGRCLYTRLLDVSFYICPSHSFTFFSFVVADRKNVFLRRGSGRRSPSRTCMMHPFLAVLSVIIDIILLSSEHKHNPLLLALLFQLSFPLIGRPLDASRMFIRVAKILCSSLSTAMFQHQEPLRPHLWFRTL